jgi:hypothetical protein
VALQLGGRRGSTSSRSSQPLASPRTESGGGGEVLCLSKSACAARRALVRTPARP